MNYLLQNNYISYWNTSLTQIQEEDLQDEVIIINNNNSSLSNELYGLSNYVYHDLTPYTVSLSNNFVGLSNYVYNDLTPYTVSLSNNFAGLSNYVYDDLTPYTVSLSNNFVGLSNYVYDDLTPYTVSLSNNFAGLSNYVYGSLSNQVYTNTSNINVLLGAEGLLNVPEELDTTVLVGTITQRYINPSGFLNDLDLDPCWVKANGQTLNRADYIEYANYLGIPTWQTSFTVPNIITPPSQIQSDWNQTDILAVDYIKNKPTIPSSQIQSDWNQTNTSAVDYIKNKPSLSPVPIGCIFPTVGSTVPDSTWLLCDGTTYTSSLYPTLATMMGGGLTFTVPDMRGRIPKGADATHSLLSSGGQDTQTLTIPNMPSHTHGAGSYGFNYSVITNISLGGLTRVMTDTGPLNLTMATTGTSGSAGSGTAFNIENKYYTINYIIKAKY